MTPQLIKEIQTKLEREFNLNETLAVLKHNRTIFWSWGVSKMTNFLDKGLLLKVNGHHHKSYVLITLAWNDTYTVYIISNRGAVLNEYKEVYFDMLTEVIDNRIEKIADYQF